MKLFLYSSYLLSSEHSLALSRFVGKAPEDITIAAIENALDVEQDTEAWMNDTRASLQAHGAQVEVVDLRAWQNNRAGLREKLASKDVIWVCGGNTFYLRWILKQSGADTLIKELVRNGKVYAGWSAGAILAGPTLEYFDAVENVTAVPEVFFDALNLTNIVVIPHIDLEDFAEGMQKVHQQLKKTGFATVLLTEAQALVIDGDERSVI
jgi:dipeptidase E